MKLEFKEAVNKVALYHHIIIFLICAEILSILTKQNNNLKGIKIWETEYKVSQLADDTTILLEGSEQSTETALGILNIFATMSGLKINKNKTIAIWIGSQKFAVKPLIIGSS